MMDYLIQLSSEYELREFERALALKEITALLPVDSWISVGKNRVLVKTGLPISEETLSRLAFADWAAVLNGGKQHQTLQRLLNRLPKLAKNGSASSRNAPVVERVRASRREHGYLTHGFHSYKGKYYPQIAGALFNWARLAPGDRVLDPFCGSGTTLVEATLRGYRSIGIDLNPLAVLISNVKCTVLLECFSGIKSKSLRLLTAIERRIGSSKTLPAEAFSERNLSYLERWFPDKTLQEIGHALAEIKEAPPVVADLFKVCLSDFLREISFQDPASLRILRRKNPPPRGNVAKRLGERVTKKLAQLETLTALRPYLKHTMTPGIAFPGDSRDLKSCLPVGETRVFEAVVTSPPYATALPYIDTDRLSLFALGLLEIDDRAALELDMIGNREIRETERRQFEEEIARNAAGLPASVLALVSEIRALNDSSDVGFRRKNTASLLYKYFSDMMRCLAEIREVTIPGARVAVVVGNSSTLAGGKEKRIIETDRLLTDIAQEDTIGLRHIESIPMTDQTTYMRHSRNAIRTETILLFERL